MFSWIRKKLSCSCSCFCIPLGKRRNKHIINKPTEKSILLKKEVKFDNISYLQNISYKETEAFIPEIRFAKVVKVYDGDTITVASKLPFNESPIYRFSVRLRSIDSPEIKGESEKECQMAIQSRDVLHNMIFGKIIELRNNGKEKYGRLLADIYYNDIHINKWMVDKGYAVKYDGGKKAAFSKATPKAAFEKAAPKL
jgi:micrococcal nuclease